MLWNISGQNFYGKHWQTKLLANFYQPPSTRRGGVRF